MDHKQYTVNLKKRADGMRKTDPKGAAALDKVCKELPSLQVPKPAVAAAVGVDYLADEVGKLRAWTQRVEQLEIDLAGVRRWYPIVFMVLVLVVLVLTIVFGARLS